MVIDEWTDGWMDWQTDTNDITNHPTSSDIFCTHVPMQYVKGEQQVGH